jgi:predicted transcriptional regulator
MDRLWTEQRPMLVRDVVDALARERQLAYTTVMTVMDILHRKGWLQRERDGRAWRYQATGTRAQYTAELMRQALSTSDDRSTALAQFVAQMSLNDAALLRQALDAASSEASPTPPPARKRTKPTGAPGNR